MAAALALAPLNDIVRLQRSASSFRPAGPPQSSPCHVPKCARRFSSYPPSKPADFDWVRFNLTLIFILTDNLIYFRQTSDLCHPGLDLVGPTMWRLEVRSRGAPGSPPSLAVSAKVASAVPHLFRQLLSALGLEDSLFTALTQIIQNKTSIHRVYRGQSSAGARGRISQHTKYI